MHGVVHTSYSSLPDCVSILEARNNIVRDVEGEAEAVGAAILEGKCVSLLIRLKWDWQDQIRPTR